MLSKNHTMEVEELFLEHNVSFHEAVDPSMIFGPQRDSLYIVIPITIIYIMIFITGLVGNIFTLIVIVRNKSMHTATNYYLCSLAISDLLLLVSGLPQEMYSIWSKWPYVFGATFCMIRGLAAETSTNASILTITLFTVERYLAICHPFLSHKMSKLSRASKHVVLLWMVAFGLALPQALQFGITSLRGVVMCLQTRIIIEHSFEISTAVFFLAPMVAITVLYSMIGLRLKRSSKGKIYKDIEGTPMRSLKKNHSQSTRRVIKMLIAVVVAFFVCWAPFHAQRLVAIYGTAENHSAKSYLFFVIYMVLTYCSGVFYYMSTCINPILYHIMCDKFRVAFKKTVLRCLHLGRGSRVERLPASTVVYATYRGSNHLGSHYSRYRSSRYEKRNSRNNGNANENSSSINSSRSENSCKKKESICEVPVYQYEINTRHHINSSNDDKPTLKHGEGTYCCSQNCIRGGVKLSMRISLDDDNSRDEGSVKENTSKAYFCNRDETNHKNDYYEPEFNQVEDTETKGGGVISSTRGYSEEDNKRETTMQEKNNKFKICLELNSIHREI